MRRPWLTLLITLGLVTCAAEAATKPSTPEQREKIVELSKLYEADVLGEKSKDLATALVKWWTEVPDLSVNWCANLLVDERPATKDLVGAMTVQSLLAAGVYVIEHVDEQVSDRSVWLAGMEGVVRAYQNVLKHDPGRKDEFLDKLTELQRAGKLGDYVDEHSASCK